jgi:hypothetical protein
MTSFTQPSPLRRFITDGLRATLDSYTRGTLPLHRLTWELNIRLDNLAAHTGLPHWRTLLALRCAQQLIATIDTALRATGRPPTPAEQHTLTHAVTTLRAALPRLTPATPANPAEPAEAVGRVGPVQPAEPVELAEAVERAEAASHAQTRAVVLAFPTHRATTGRPTLIA